MGMERRSQGASNNWSLTFYGVPEELIIMYGDQRVTKQGAEQVEEWDDAAGIFKGHGRAP